MTRSQEIRASVSLRRPSFPGRSPFLTEGRGRPITELNPNRLRVLRKEMKTYFATAHRHASAARPLLEKLDTYPTEWHGEPYVSPEQQQLESYVLEMQIAREQAMRIIRTIRAAKIVDGRGQKWGPAGREFRTDSGNFAVRFAAASEALDEARKAMQTSLAAHKRCLPQIQGVLPIQDTEQAIRVLEAAVAIAGKGTR